MPKSCQTNCIQKGNLGSVVVEQLVDAGFIVTVLTRNAGSVTGLPQGVKISEVDYSSPESLEAALRGNDVAISTMGMGALPVQKPVIDACIKAGVRRFIPNDFGSFTSDPKAQEVLPFLAGFGGVHKYLAEKAEAGVLEWTHFSTGGFLENFVQMPSIVDFQNRKAVLYNYGNHPLSVTRRASVGKAMAAALAKPDTTKNRDLFIHDALISQAKLVAIGKRVVKGEWTETYLDGNAEYKMALEAQQNGDFSQMSILRLLSAALLTGQFAGAYLTVDNDMLGLGYLSDEKLEATIATLVG